MDTQTKGYGLPDNPIRIKNSPADFGVREADPLEVRENEVKRQADTDAAIKRIGLQAAVEKRVAELRFQAAVDERVRQLRQQAAIDRQGQDDLPYPRLRGHGFDNG